jgi:hypothetical protein
VTPLPWKFCLLTLVSFAFANKASAAQWICLTEQSTGFYFDTALKLWKPTNFRSESKFVVKNSTLTGYKYDIKKVGQEFPIASCKDDFFASTFLHCSGIGGSFKFNKVTLRFQNVYEMGYFNPTPGLNNAKEGEDTPAIEIGKCSEF